MRDSEHRVEVQESDSEEALSRRDVLQTALYVAPAILTLSVTPTFANTGSKGVASGCTDGGLTDWDTDGNDGDTDSDSDGLGDDSDTDFCP